MTDPVEAEVKQARLRIQDLEKLRDLLAARVNAAEAEVEATSAVAKRLAQACQTSLEDTSYCPACECHEHDEDCDVLAILNNINNQPETDHERCNRECPPRNAS